MRPEQPRGTEGGRRSPSQFRVELGAFLRSRRERLTPKAVGFPAGSRRRAPGLRREEVALLADVSATWYTYLEQGRDVHPSNQVLDAIARALQFSEDERRYLRRLAEQASTVPLVGELSPRDIAAALVRLGDESPFPIYAADVYGDVHAWNPSAVSYYTDFSALPVERRNMILWLVSDPAAREKLLDWESETRDVVARWRRRAADADPEQLARRVQQCRRASDEFGHWWDSRDVKEHRSRLRRFRHPDLGVVTLRVIVVDSAELGENFVVYHAPVDTAAEQRPTAATPSSP